MKVGVTGGAGFIGSHVVDHLVAAGHEVVVLDMRPPHRADVGFAPADILDLGALRRGLDGCGAVFHLAGVANVNDAAVDPSRTFELNVLGTARVWEAARAAGVRRAVLASTVWVYGAAAGDGPVDEEATFELRRAGHVYTSSKIAAELVVQSCRELYDQEFVILRYGIPFGPRMREELVIPRFVGAALAGEPITVQGDGSQYRNYVYVEDLAAAHVLALEPGAANEVFNLEGPEQVTVRELVESITALLPEPVTVAFTEARAGDYSGRPVSSDHARTVLGWAPAVAFSEGLRRYVDWHLHERRQPGPPAARRPAAARLGAAALGAAALPALAFHGWSAIAVGERVASVLVAGLAAWAAARRARRSAPSLAGGAAVLAAAWLLSQAGGPLALLVALVLGLGIGLSSPEPAPLIWASAGLAAATGAALVGLGATTRPAVALWAGAALVVVAGWGGLAARLRDGFRPRRVNLALASTISAATVFVTLMVGATSAEATWFGSPVSHGPRQGGEVALTFDTSSAAATAAVARVLAAQGAPATFFTSAWDVLADPSVARDILGWKQVVGSAMYDRSPMSALAPWRHQAERAQRVFRRRAGVCPAFLMPPHGEHTPFMARAARRRGMLMVTWDVAVDPAQEKDAADVAERVLGRARSGSIIRIDLTRGGPATAPTVAAALPAVLRGLRARGLTPAPLYTLLHHPAYVAHC